MKRKEIIAGPCALESREQFTSTLDLLRKHKIKIARGSLWKPRTKPHWDGIGDIGIKTLLEECYARDLIPATEIFYAKHAYLIINEMVKLNPNGKLLLWIGSRNQLHFEQQSIGKVLKNAPEGVFLMFKNQPWEDEDHWIGICEHLLQGGMNKDRLCSCHRGFSPGQMDNPDKLRNLPNFEMAMRVKDKLSIPMYFDPSHVGGSCENVIKTLLAALEFDFDGFMIETHYDPENAKTDSEQQLSHEHFKTCLDIINEQNISGVNSLIDSRASINI